MSIMSAAFLLDTLRDAEKILYEARQHGLKSEPSDIDRNRARICVNLDEVEAHIKSIRAMVGPTVQEVKDAA